MVTELGPDLFLDTAVIDDASARRARRALTVAKSVPGQRMSISFRSGESDVAYELRVRLPLAHHWRAVCSGRAEVSFAVWEIDQPKLNSIDCRL